MKCVEDEVEAVAELTTDRGVGDNGVLDRSSLESSLEVLKEFADAHQLSAETKLGFESSETGDGLLGGPLAVFVPCEKTSCILDGTVGLVPTDGRRPESQQLREVWVKDDLLEGGHCN